MRFQHTECGGEIDVKTRQCARCKKKWNPIAFRFDPAGIRPLLDSKGKLASSRSASMSENFKKVYGGKGKTGYASWGDSVPGLASFASRLPRWPRWARILTTVIFLAVVATVVIILVGR